MLKTGHRTKYHLRAFEFLAARRRSRAVLTCTLLASFLATMPTGGLQAGDILRGGASAGNAKRNSDARANAGAAAAEAAKVRAQDRLARTTKAVNDMRALQASARAAAGANAIPNGLTPGGLELRAGHTPVGANLPTPAGNNVNITQTAAQALLEWKTFNVGSQTTVNFDQSAGGADSGKWIAFNKVVGSAAPSEIRGKINAQGQVYIINQNGIIFGAGSQVNTRALVASTLPINDVLRERGILNQEEKNVRFLLDGALRDNSIGTGKIGDVIVESGAVLSAPTNEAKSGGRIILAGANVENNGSLFAPDGQVILAAGLQMGFEASSDATLRGLKPYVGKVSGLKDSNNVDVLPSATSAGTAKNNGLIEVTRGSAYLVGSQVHQNGVIQSSTSVALNGRTDLMANYGATPNADFTGSGQAFYNTQTGNVYFGENSLIAILPDWADPEKSIGSKLALITEINAQGRNIHLGKSATLHAPGAKVSFESGNWSADTPPLFKRGTGQIYLDQGSLIDVSGSNAIKVPVTQNIIELSMRGAEFARSPLQRTGPLRGTDLNIDVRRSGSVGDWQWIGTPLGDVTGYAALIEKGVGQLTLVGGTVDLKAGGSIVTQGGSIIDVSGGFVEWQPGMTKTSRLRSGGSIIDVSDATPDRVFDGIHSAKSFSTSTKWGITKTFVHPMANSGERFERSYLEGSDAGIVRMYAPSIALDGRISAETVEGPRQHRQTSSTVGYEGSRLTAKKSLIGKPPKGGTLAIEFTGDYLEGTAYYKHSPLPPTITFRDGTSLAPVGAFPTDGGTLGAILDPSRIASFIISPEELEENGISNLTIDNGDGDVLIPSGVAISTRPGGSVVLKGKNVDVQGSITSPSGSVSLTAYSISPYEYARSSITSLPLPGANRGLVSLGAAAALNVAGVNSDDSPTTNLNPLATISRKGGSVLLEGLNVQTAVGSLINASSGISISAIGKISYGDGGSISLKAGQDPSYKSILGGKLIIGGTLNAYGGLTGKGGSLTIQSQTVQIGGSTQNPQTLLLSPEFFNQGGFSTFNIAGLGEPNTGAPGQFTPAVLVSGGVNLSPIIQTTTVSRNSNSQSTFARVVTEPQIFRPPVNLKFSGSSVKNSFTGAILARGEVVLADSATISLEPGMEVSKNAWDSNTLGSVTFEGEAVSILGSLSVPGGRISISGGTIYLSETGTPSAYTTVYLGSNSRLSTAGKLVTQPDSYGRQRGWVLPGGSISLQGNIVAQRGALLDVSGASGKLDLTDSERGVAQDSSILSSRTKLTSGPLGIYTERAMVESDAGKITLKGGQMLYSEATLLGKSGGPTALGGSLFVSSGRYVSGDTYDSDINLLVTQTQANLLQSQSPGIGLPLLDGAGVVNEGRFAVETFKAGGFDVLALDGNVRFSGAVDITATRALRVGTGGVIYANDEVNLTSPYVALGQVFRDPINPDKDTISYFKKSIAGISSDHFFAPTFGPGSLNVTADLIDVGTLSFQNIGSVYLNAASGDIRGSGTLNIRGDLRLTAGQIYPATASSFNIFAYDPNTAGGVKGSITIRGGEARPIPYSAGGELNFYASLIDQGGTLRAPMGSITLGWDGTGTAPSDPITGSTLTRPTTETLTLAAGSLTSVSGSGLYIPYGVSPDGNSWLDPRGVDITASKLKSKQITLSGRSVATAAGSELDISGGGDLFAFRWIEGNGGPSDILTSSTSFAVIPGYNFDYAPFGAFNDLTDVAGFVNSAISAGDKIYLSGGGGLAAGSYTLLPARYAMLPGAFLVTPSTGSPARGLNRPDGSAIVSGYRSNALGGTISARSLHSIYEVASSEVIANRAEYTTYKASEFLPMRAAQLGITTQRLPSDSGALVFKSQTAMELKGSVKSAALAGARGSKIDISATLDFTIKNGSGTPTVGSVFLDSSTLTSWGADSLLVGATRSTTGLLSVAAENITIDNSGSTLTAPELIFAATDSLVFAPNSSVVATGTLSGSPESLQIVGDGALTRISAAASPVTSRTGTTASAVPILNIGAGARLVGTSVALDSSSRMTIDATAEVLTSGIRLSAGRISIAQTNPGVLPADAGLILSGSLLTNLGRSSTLALQSYSSLDFYGTGSFGETLSTLTLQGRQMRGFNLAGGEVLLNAEKILLENPGATILPGIAAAPSGNLRLNTGTVQFGSGTIDIDQFSTISFSTSQGIYVDGDAVVDFSGSLIGNVPRISGSDGSTLVLKTDGAIDFSKSGTSSIASGLAPSLSFEASSIQMESDILASSGLISLKARTGNIQVAGVLNAQGTEQRFFDVVKYTDGGTIRLEAPLGNISLQAGSNVSVASHAGGGNAGYFSASTPTGTVTMGGTLSGSAPTAQRQGSAQFDIGSLASFANLNTTLRNGGFSEEINIRLRDGGITIAETVLGKKFTLSVDKGDITIGNGGFIDARGTTGGSIALVARGSVTLESGSRLSVRADKFSNAGKGGSVRLEAGAATNVSGSVAANLDARLDLKGGSEIDLSVKNLADGGEYVAGDYLIPGSSAFLGKFQGTLHLRAPRNIANSDLLINPIGASVVGASSIFAEGFEVQTAPAGLITGWRSDHNAPPEVGTLQRTIYDRAASFLSVANHSSMATRLLGADTQSLSSLFVIAPGVEIINSSGSLSLGNTNEEILAQIGAFSSANADQITSLGSSVVTSADWNLSDFRFGPKLAPGILTLRAAGDIAFNNSLSDGFTTLSVANTSARQNNANSSLWLGQLQDLNPLLPLNTQSWSFRISAGADFGSANVAAVNSGAGSVLVGEYYPAVPNTSAVGVLGLTRDAMRIFRTSGADRQDLGTRYEVVRTGTGDIMVTAGSDIRLRNDFATIYTAGTRIPNPQNIYSSNDFRPPTFYFQSTSEDSSTQDNNSLGAAQQFYGKTGYFDESGIIRRIPQWALAGGNVQLAAINNIGHYTTDTGLPTGNMIAASSRQQPTNWLFRRGAVENSVFDSITHMDSLTDPSTSTTWWVDYSNFFQGVGTLGGGDITMSAGGDIINFDAVAPTNARMAGKDALGFNIAPNAALLLELGGGDVTVRAGANLDGGIYYVERGKGALTAGKEITTNSARAPSFEQLQGLTNTQNELTWLPTTLFLGKGQFSVSASKDILLGPMLNPFLLPAGLNNRVWYNTAFSTYSSDSAVTVTSLGGGITHRLAATLNDASSATPIFSNWLEKQNLFDSSKYPNADAPKLSAAYYQPWIRLAEKSLDAFSTSTTIAAPSLRSTSFGGSVSVVGDLNLYPSESGTLELLAKEKVEGLNPTGLGKLENVTGMTWISSQINLSDADPELLNTILNPYGRLSSDSRLMNAQFSETGSYTGASASISVKQSLHAKGVLHANDSNPLRIYAKGGDISAIGLFSAKKANIFASNDISDVSFYIQNTTSQDNSIISAGRDILAYNANTEARENAASTGNILSAGEAPLSGDLQISGPGTLQVLAGRHIDLGTGSGSSDGTGSGITSIGNARNPYLPSDGAQLIVAAGLGETAQSLSASSLNLQAFIDQFVMGAEGGTYLAELGISNFESLSQEAKAAAALEVFYLLLRDSGRSASEGSSSAEGKGGYETGFEAIETLFGSIQNPGDILARSRDIRTKSGGDIHISIPGGKLELASTKGTGENPIPPGIVTESGGNINIFANDDVSIGIGRIFTLRGGNIVIWSSTGDIAAGVSSKTVQSAPPTRVLIDPQSGALETDLAGLATGGGIGVLATVEGVEPGDVDLIAPEGIVDAGDAGIRSTGNLNIAATAVLNASNISTGGSSSGVPSAAPVAAPNVGGLTSGSSSSAAANSAANSVANQSAAPPKEAMETPSMITVEILGYGGGEGDSSEEENEG
jgi:filamentous hemagglutinin family protein